MQDAESDEVGSVGLIDAVPDMVVVVDATGTIQYANAASETVLGWPPDELVGQSIAVLIPEDRRSSHRHMVAGFFLSPSDRVMGSRRIDGLHRDGHVVAVDIRIAPRRNRGDVVAVVRDISDLRRAQEKADRSVHELAAMNSRLRSVLEDRNRLLGVAAHDLRNPLTTIVALSDAMLHGVEPQSTAAEGLETVVESSLYMRDLVDDLLEWSSLEAGSLRLDPQQVDLRALVAAAGRQLRPIGRSKGVELHIEFPDEFPMVSVDAAKFRQVVHNLVGNAIKFTPSGGRVELVLTQENGHCCLLVKDQGPGLSAEDTERIFLPFQKGLSKATAGEFSAGLGLAIVQRIVDGHGGEIQLHSKPGQGAVFEVCLPLDGGPVAALSALAETSPTLKIPAVRSAGDEPGRATVLGLIDGLLREAPVACLLVDAAGVIVTANKRAHALFGVPPGQLRSQGLSMLVPVAFREQHKLMIQRFFKSPAARAMGTGPVIRGLHATGRELPLQVGLGLVEVGSELFALAVAEDLSERLAARREAEEAVARLQQGSATDRLVAESELGLLVFSASGDRLLFANPAGRSLLEETGMEPVLGLTSSGWDKPIRLTALDFGGSPRSIEGAARPTEWEGQPARLVQLRDVTARERLHDQLLTIEKLGLVGQLASNVAHDFNNLLAKIQGALELARSETTSIEQVTRLAEIERSVELGAELTSRLLFLSRKTVGTVTAVDMRSVVLDIEPLMRQLVPKEIALLLDVPKEVLAVQGDPVQLEQVVMNLVTNARDACLEQARVGATIEVRLRALDAGTRLHSDVGAADPDIGIARVALEVVDNGSGMTAEVLEKIFEPFFTTRETGRGTGLGLASVRAVVERCNGRIAVNSDPGLGSSFTLVLPRVPGEDGVWSGSQAFSRVPGKRTVLVVDDESAIRRILVEHLRREGLQTYDAATAVAALAVADKLEYLDLLVTDLVMPEVDGWALAEQLRETRPNLAVLLMTGYGHDVLASHVVDVDSIELLSKPFRLAEATAKVTALLASTPEED